MQTVKDFTHNNDLNQQSCEGTNVVGLCLGQMSFINKHYEQSLHTN